jgi:hypothetical protein
MPTKVTPEPTPPASEPKENPSLSKAVTPEVTCSASDELDCIKLLAPLTTSIIHDCKQNFFLYQTQSG